LINSSREDQAIQTTPQSYARVDIDDVGPIPEIFSTISVLVRFVDNSNEDYFPVEGERPSNPTVDHECSIKLRRLKDSFNYLKFVQIDVFEFSRIFSFGL